MSESIKVELLDFFNAIKFDQGSEAKIQKSTLISLLLYQKIDQQLPQFFRYISRKLQKLPSHTISQKQYLRVFMNPEIDLQNADHNELAQAFSLLDENKNGSISMEEFLEIYRKSENYQKATEARKKQTEDQIKDAFYSTSENGKITPIDFYNIVKFK